MWYWSFVWRRSWLLWEIPLLDEFMFAINLASLHPKEEDKILWRGTASSNNLVKDADHVLSREMESEDSPLKCIWDIKIPNTIGIFLWRLFMDRLPSRINLRNKHVSLPGLDYLCSFCHGMDEDLVHLLFSCKVASDV